MVSDGITLFPHRHLSDISPKANLACGLEGLGFRAFGLEGLGFRAFGLEGLGLQDVGFGSVGGGVFG